MRRKLIIIVTVAFLIFLGIFWFPKQRLNTPASNPEYSTPVYSYRLVNTYPHDTKAFTQGLIYDQGWLYEGTGLYGASSLRKVELETGKVQQIKSLAKQYFGEGITIWQNKVLQLTWKSGIGFVYDQETFNLEGKFSYTTEGWGLTHDDSRLIMSDGTDKIYFLDPETLTQTDSIQVRDQGKAIKLLNELEYIEGEIWANIWTEDRIARIDPQNGEVIAWLDLTGLNPHTGASQEDVLNGIAYDSQEKRIFVTGKLWSKLFEIEVEEGR